MQHCLRTIMKTTSLVSENIRGKALAYNAFPFLGPSCLRESSLFQWCHFYSNLPLCKKHISCSNTPQTPKEGYILFDRKRTPKRGKDSLASEQAHCLLIKPPPTQLSSQQQPKDQPSAKISHTQGNYIGLYTLSISQPVCGLWILLVSI